METFEAYRPLLFGLAYRMLGSAADAEDIVQETYLRYRATPAEQVRSPKAFLSTIAARLSLNLLKSARRQRETYVGPWLPEPVLTRSGALAPNPAEQVTTEESISMAFLVLIECLTPAERAAFLLREVFDFEYAEIAQILDKAEPACRQLFHRAQRRLAEHRPRFKSTPAEHERLLKSFLHAASAGDLGGLTALLAEDAVLWSDGGGKVVAATRPVRGRKAVARFLVGATAFAPPNLQLDVRAVNGRLGIVARTEDGAPFLVVDVEAGDGLIQELRLIANPDKLAALDHPVPA